jgi:hypothetical protein
MEKRLMRISSRRNCQTAITKVNITALWKYFRVSTSEELKMAEK